MTAPGLPRLSPTRLGARELALALAGLWVVDAVLQLQPGMFTSNFSADILYNAALMYQPPGITAFLLAVARLEAAHAATLTVAIAAIQLLLASGLLFPRTRKAALWASVAWAAAIWVFGEGFGFLFTGTVLLEAGSPGSALLYLALALLAVQALRADNRLDPRFATGLWSAYWGLGVLLHLPVRYAPGAVLAYNLQTAAQLQPGGLSTLDYHLASAAFATGIPLTLVLAALELGLALGPWSSRWRTASLVMGVAAGLLFWVLGQAMGGIFTGVSTDPNTGPLVILLGLSVAAAWGQRGGNPFPARSQSPGLDKKRDPAMTYSPTPLPGQYHRR